MYYVTFQSQTLLYNRSQVDLGKNLYKDPKKSQESRFFSKDPKVSRFLKRRVEMTQHF